MSTMSSGKNFTGTNEITPIKRKEMIVSQIKAAFWVPIYLKNLVLFGWLMGTYPDPVRVTKTIRKDINVTLPQTYKQKGFKAVLVRLFLPFSHHGGEG